MRILHDYKTIILSLLSLLFADLCLAGTPLGAWRGELMLGQMKLPLVLNFSEDGQGNAVCTLDSPSQGAKGLPTVVEYCSSDSISLKCNLIGASYNGKIEASAIKGTFSQRGYTFPLDLKPETAIEDRRPQTPKPPYPYSVTDTTFTAPDGAVLSGTLTMPAVEGNRKVPAIVMVTGSGAQNRDEEIFEHKPFAVIADYLARNGIASLRYDDRGFGKSTGNLKQATTYTFKDDAASGLKLLRSIKNVGQVGVMGHSEGGTIAFMLAADNLPDFIISLAGMSESGKETLLRQNSLALDKMGLTLAEKESQLRLLELFFDSLAEQANKGVSTPIDVDSLVQEAGIVANRQIVASLKTTQNARTPWIDAFAALNPAKVIDKIKCPVLAINGDKDTQVNADANLAIIRNMIPGAEVRLMPGLNHLMQHAATGEVTEYGEIKETISPEVLEIITAFIKKHTN